MADEGYPELLRSSIESVGSSRRKLSFDLAAETGNQQPDEYRSLGKYMSKTKPETPSRERAAILAVLLKEPRLALVSEVRTRRQARLAELAATVDQLETALEGALTRIEALEARAQPRRRRADGEQ
jgi:hypothetical protein